MKEETMSKGIAHMIEMTVQEVATAITAENLATSAENVQSQERKEMEEEEEDQLLAIIANKRVILPVIATNQEKKEKVTKEEPATNGKRETAPMVIHADLLMKEKEELVNVKVVEAEIAVDTVMTEAEIAVEED